MKVLAVSDATWQALERVLERSDEGLEVLARMTAPAPELPDANELLVASTDRDLTPEVFALAIERRDALEAALGQARLHILDLLVQARAMRVSVLALERWTGLSNQHIYEETNDARARRAR